MGLHTSKIRSRQSERVSVQFILLWEVREPCLGVIDTDAAEYKKSKQSPPCLFCQGARVWLVLRGSPHTRAPPQRRIEIGDRNADACASRSCQKRGRRNAHVASLHLPLRSVIWRFYIVSVTCWCKTLLDCSSLTICQCDALQPKR